MLEVQADFAHPRLAVFARQGSQFDGGDQVFLGVGAQMPDGELRAGKDDRFGQPREHETQRRSGIGHRIGAVQYHEAVVGLVTVAHHRSDLHPVGRGDIGRVQQMVECVGIQRAVDRAGFGQVGQDVVKVERTQPAGYLVPHHADGPSGVDQQDFRKFILFHSFSFSSVFSRLNTGLA